MEAISAIAPTRILRPAMRQVWRDLTFLHWRYSPEVVRPLVPPQLELDLWEGDAWVGLAPFAIEGISNFVETNVRTYVVDRRGRRGVWFFSLDAASLAAVMAARALYALPYYWARMRLEREGSSVVYRSRRIGTKQTGCDLRVRVGEPIRDAGELDLFLTARFRLFAQRLGHVRPTEIDHPPWPLRHASVAQLRQNLVEAAGLPGPEGTPLAHFSERIEVTVGWPRDSV